MQRKNRNPPSSHIHLLWKTLSKQTVKLTLFFMFASEPETVPNTVEKVEVAQEVANCKMKECNPFLDSQMQSHRGMGAVSSLFTPALGQIISNQTENTTFWTRENLFSTHSEEKNLNTLNMTAWKPQLFCPPRQTSNKSDNKTQLLQCLSYIKLAFHYNIYLRMQPDHLISKTIEQIKIKS